MLYKETVEPATLGLLKDLMSIPELEQFRLVGGTALSLLLGHRASIDLDLFTDRPFNREVIIDALAEKFSSLSIQEFKSSRLFFTTINNVKVDFVCTFEKFINNYDITEGIRFAALDDIIALKLNAIAGRGAKKDFWDLNELLNHYSFDQMLSSYQQKYPNNSSMMVLKSATYFIDADLQPDPICFKKLGWDTIKKKITKEVNLYINTKR
ncbi:nucleotidyl transferase AbiEii/AbiGii toxin family protein [Mucilaginibacter sp. RS28]|uniref:Nucleotidyl transferase AbiEii/AbiGii toxin family protein n=1 Tax=Mucilaginibacter straminoryzae TaxID=2932774 RepID=A0A9X1X3C0_9SPHI|nr:nucleotidyl transferase AbiEii/AbiGii toxin family protein [Mucilaginibacter straminoryzae]MCJ8210116.1 nucleotidyl transferase AbiEii/AbiGii toxin family protein [Mucilaginibacter straminoryzae]